MIFLFRRKEDDRDCCAYIEPQPRFECGHYFGSVALHGACYCNHDFPEYDEIETILTESEYKALVDYNDFINNLGYGITEGDDRYKQGINAYTDVAPVFEKLCSLEAKAFFADIIASEKDYMKEEYGLDDDDIEDIFSEYTLDYRDRGIIGCVFADTNELGYEEAWSLGYIDPKDPISSRYFNYEKFGEDLLEDDWYLKLCDGRVATLNY